jgi:hypothetical protein
MSSGHLFLSYGREDHATVCNVYTAMRKAGLNPWMDRPPTPWETEGIPPGVPWESYIRTKIESAERVLCFLSCVTVVKVGYVQSEVRLALKCVALRPSDQPFLVPIRLDKCKMPDLEVETIRLSALSWFDLFDYGLDGLLKVFGERKSGEDRVDPRVVSVMLAEEATRSAKKDMRIAELQSELAFARKQVPPPEVWHDKHAMEWWLAHRYDEPD